MTTGVKGRGMEVWKKPLKEPATVPTIFLTTEAVLQGLREEYTPDMLPVRAMYDGEQIVRPFWRGRNDDIHFTLRGWVQALRHQRAHAPTIEEASWRLEEAFLELYPPFGEFTPPLRVPWTRGKVKSGPRLPTVEYSLTSVFDSKILQGRGGWEAFHRLISRAIWNQVEGKSQKAALQNIWKNVGLEEKLSQKFSNWAQYYQLNTEEHPTFVSHNVNISVTQG